MVFSAALCRGLIEAGIAERIGDVSQGRFPRLYAAASLKLCLRLVDVSLRDGFPRLYAAASLKHRLLARADEQLDVFSAALCRGLIEAPIRCSR